MKGNEPIRQHLVPRCYLKNFALARRKEWFIHAYDKTLDESKVFSANIKNVCVETDFYTFKKLPDSDKRFLERYYSNTIEADYREVYDALTKSKSGKLSPNLRFKIVSFVMCQFFRTSKSTNAINSIWSRMLEHGSKLTENREDKKIYYEGDVIADFNTASLEKIVSDQSDDTRELVNIESYRLFKKWTLEKLDYLICVHHVYDKEFSFIIGDNPVLPHGHIFDPESSIHMPLNPYQCLTLMPLKHGSVGHLNEIQHLSLDREYSRLRTLFNNVYQYENCQRFILGREDAVKNAVVAIKNFNPDDFNKEAAVVLKRTNEIISHLENLKSL